MNLSCLCAVSLLSAGTVLSAADTLLVMPPEDAAPIAMAPGSTLAPWKLIAASEENSKIASAVLECKGLNPALISSVTVFSNLGEYEDYLLHFPFNRKNQAAKLHVRGNLLELTFEPQIPVPAVLSRNVGLLLGFTLSPKAPAGEFEIALKSLTLGTENIEPDNASCQVRTVPGKPQAAVSVDRITTAAGIPAIRLTVTPAQPMAFPPGIALQFPALKLNDSHRWGDRYRTLLTPEDGGKLYELVWPAYAVLSDNFLPQEERKTSYTVTPKPDGWKLRADNTGFDLFDADARSAFHANPGGIEFLNAEKITMVVDLHREAEIGGVSLYGMFGLRSIALSVSADGVGNWSEPVTVECPMQPQEKFGMPTPGIAAGLSPAMFNLFLPQLQKGRYCKLEIDCNRNTSVALTELIVWGLAPDRKPQLPYGGQLYLTGADGATDSRSIPFSDTNR